MRPTWGQLTIGALVLAGSAASLKVPAILLGGTDETTPHLVAPRQQGHPRSRCRCAAPATSQLPPFLGRKPGGATGFGGNGNAVVIAARAPAPVTNGRTVVTPLTPPKVDPTRHAKPIPQPNPTPTPFRRRRPSRSEPAPSPSRLLRRRPPPCLRLDPAPTARERPGLPTPVVEARKAHPGASRPPGASRSPAASAASGSGQRAEGERCPLRSLQRVPRPARRRRGPAPGRNDRHCCASTFAAAPAPAAATRQHGNDHDARERRGQWQGEREVEVDRFATSSRTGRLLSMFSLLFSRAPFALTLAAWRLWRRVPACQRRELMRMARQHGPKLARAARGHRRRPPSRPPAALAQPGQPAVASASRTIRSCSRRCAVG